MSEQPGQSPPPGPSEDEDVASADAPLEERPAVAGGSDDGPPAQGEGAADSW